MAVISSPQLFLLSYQNFGVKCLHYHGILANLDRQESGTKLVAYGFYSWQINQFFHLEEKDD